MLIFSIQKESTPIHTKKKKTNTRKRKHFVCFVKSAREAINIPIVRLYFLCLPFVSSARRWLSARCPQHTAGSSAAQTVSSRCPLTPRPRARCPPRATWAARGAPSKPLSSSLCMSVWHPSSSFTPIVDLVKGFRSAPFISLVIAVNVDKSLPACLLLEYDFYFVFCVYLGQKVGCILTLGECVCLCLSHCVFLSHPSTQTCISLHVCIRHACTHTDIPMQTCVCTAAHAQLRHTPHAHTPNLQ